MAGHSKWKQIKHKKAATDAARSKVFSRFARLVAVESKKVGGDMNAASLRTIVDRAKAENMPKENIERAVAKGAGSDGATYEAVLYETYGPGGVAILISALTDSTNRTAQEIKLLLSNHDCSLAVPGSARWAFAKTADGYAPNSTIDVSEADAQKLDTLLEALEEHDDVQETYTNAA